MLLFFEPYQCKMTFKSTHICILLTSKNVYSAKIKDLIGNIIRLLVCKKWKGINYTKFKSL